MTQSLFGGKAQMKVLRYFISNRDSDFIQHDIAAGAEISRTTAALVLKYLLSNNLILISRKIGKSPLFKLNAENETVKAMVALLESGGFFERHFRSG
jgi:hypothetical protein